MSAAAEPVKVSKEIDLSKCKSLYIKTGVTLDELNKQTDDEVQQIVKSRVMSVLNVYGPISRIDLEKFEDDETNFHVFIHYRSINGQGYKEFPKFVFNKEQNYYEIVRHDYEFTTKTGNKLKKYYTLLPTMNEVKYCFRNIHQLSFDVEALKAKNKEQEETIKALQKEINDLRQENSFGFDELNERVDFNYNKIFNISQFLRQNIMMKTWHNNNMYKMFIQTVDQVEFPPMEFQPPPLPADFDPTQFPTAVPPNPTVDEPIKVPVEQEVSAPATAVVETA